MSVYHRCFDTVSLFMLRTLSVLKETNEIRQQGEMLGAFFIYNQMLLLLRHTLPPRYPVDDTIRRLQDSFYIFPDAQSEMTDTVQALAEDDTDFDSFWCSILESIKAENLDEIADTAGEFIEDVMNGIFYQEEDLVAGMKLACTTLENLSAEKLAIPPTVAASPAMARHLN